MRAALCFCVIIGLCLRIGPALAEVSCEDVDRGALDMRLELIDVSTSERRAFLNPAGGSEATELHVIAGSRQDTPEAKALMIGRSDKPLALLMVSGPGVWQVSVAEGTRLARLMVVGDRDAIEFRGLPAGVAVEWLSTSCSRNGLHWRASHGLALQMFLSEIRGLAGQVEASYQYYKDKAIVPLPRPAAAGPVITLPMERPASSGGQPFATPAALLDFLGRAIDRKVLPAALPRAVMRPDQLRFAPLIPADLPHEPPRRVRSAWECNGIVPGTQERDWGNCVRGDAILFTGAGNDVIQTSWGYQIVDAGPGNDDLLLGWNSAVVVFPLGWGNDFLEKTCHFGEFKADEVPGASQHADFQYPWANFIVFGDGIKPDDLEVVGETTLRHRQSGDTLEFGQGRCFNAVFSDAPGVVWNIEQDLRRLAKERQDRERPERELRARQQAAEREEWEKQRRVRQEEQQAEQVARLREIARTTKDDDVIGRLSRRIMTSMSEDDYRGITTAKALTLAGPTRDIPMVETPAIAEGRLAVLAPGEGKCKPARATDFCLHLQTTSSEACEALILKVMGQSGMSINGGPMVDRFRPRREDFPRDSCAKAAPVVIWRFSGHLRDGR